MSPKLLPLISYVPVVFPQDLWGFRAALKGAVLSVSQSNKKGRFRKSRSKKSLNGQNVTPVKRKIQSSKTPHASAGNSGKSRVTRWFLNSPKPSQIPCYFTIPKIPSSNVNCDWFYLSRRMIFWEKIKILEPLQKQNSREIRLVKSKKKPMITYKTFIFLYKIFLAPSPILHDIIIVHSVISIEQSFLLCSKYSSWSEWKEESFFFFFLR